MSLQMEDEENCLEVVNLQEEEEQEEEEYSSRIKSKCHLPQRYIMASFGFTSSFLAYFVRTNLSIALPLIINQKERQGKILSSFFYGYMVSMLFSGMLASKYGSKRVLAIGMGLSAFFDLLTIWTTNCTSALYFVRCMMGIGAGTMFPCLHQIAAAWYPKNERDRLISFVGSGADLGVICSMVFVPFLIQLIGWENVFVLGGLCGIIWAILFEIYGADSPETSRRISKKEKQYILQQTTRKKSVLLLAAATRKVDNKILWKVLLTHRETWAIYIANFCYDYGWYVFHGWIPQYLMEVVHIDLGGHDNGKSSGLKGAIPYVCGYFGVLFWGRLSNYLLDNEKLTRVQVRQLMNGVSFFGFGLFLFLLRYTSSSSMALFLLSLTLFTGRAGSVGFWVNMIDICPDPHHAGILMSISNTIGNLPGIIANVVTGKILAATGEWNAVFLIASLILFGGGLFFHLNASDQPIEDPLFDQEEPPQEDTNGSTGKQLYTKRSSGSLEETDLEEEEEEQEEEQEKVYNDQQALLSNCGYHTNNM